MNISLNLLPDVKKELLRVQRERNIVIVASLGACAVSVGILLSMFATKLGFEAVANVSKSNIEKYEKQIKDAQDKKQLNKYLTIQNQLKQITSLKQNQKVYSRLLGYLDGLNPAAPNSVKLQTMTLTDSSVQGSDLSTDSQGDGIVMTITGVTGSYPSLDVYKNTLENAKLAYELKDESDQSDSSDTSSESNSDSDSNSDSSSSTDESDSTTDNSTDKEADNSASDQQANAENTISDSAPREKLFSNVVVKESALSTDESNQSVVRFTIQVTFSAHAFDSQVEKYQLEIPSKTTSDADRNAPTFEKVNTKNTNDSNNTDTNKQGSASNE